MQTADVVHVSEKPAPSLQSELDALTVKRLPQTAVASDHKSRVWKVLSDASERTQQQREILLRFESADGADRTLARMEAEPSMCIFQAGAVSSEPLRIDGVQHHGDALPRNSCSNQHVADLARDRD